MADLYNWIKTYTVLNLCYKMFICSENTFKASPWTAKAWLCWTNINGTPKSMAINNTSMTQTMLSNNLPLGNMEIIWMTFWLDFHVHGFMNVTMFANSRALQSIFFISPNILTYFNSKVHHFHKVQTTRLCHADVPTLPSSFHLHYEYMSCNCTYCGYIVGNTWFK